MDPVGNALHLIAAFAEQTGVLMLFYVHQLKTKTLLSENYSSDVLYFVFI